MPPFSGKTVIVTGSSSGIGREAVRLFARKGANVVIHGQSESKLKEFTASLEKCGLTPDRYLVVQGPIQDEKTRSALINGTLKKFGRIDVLVNNAGAQNDPADPDLDSVHNLEFLFNVNFKSMYDLNDKVYPHLRKTKGNIVNISSAGSQIVPPFAIAYASLKAAVDAYSKGLAVKYGPEVRVNSISPGPTSTEFSSRQQGGNGNLLETFKKIIPKLPLGRIGNPEEVANAIVFVAGKDAKYITGSVIVVDGGFIVGMPYAR
ncbi:unnamed protein product [Bursaphelenchus xylophilus]|uniref:(pine wood nematode) hypothetical protein n=1 Tax=Bursaphelenchus xylophilus TaxID=6326 RepID=A0A1I7SUP0_BURXY|nr:unnamed protein product [Bursaphelenchus xylophilus]CAG9125987.1 unnamed protein product [Bursaphelenchus xylophilus]